LSFLTTRYNKITLKNCNRRHGLKTIKEYKENCMAFDAKRYEVKNEIPPAFNLEAFNVL